MSKNPYHPKSHFFVDHANLSTTNPDNIAADAFGPVDGNETNEYRVTSFIRTSGTSKVFAICAGQLLVQPHSGDITKVNLILKPTASYAPFKIKYFIYRGVNKAELINGTDLVPQTTAIQFIQRVWEAHIKLMEDQNEPVSTTLSTALIGYDSTNQPDTDLLSEVFFGSGTMDIEEYNIPLCKKGEHIGNFTGKIGLDIVLDYGDYELEYEEQLFKLDLEYARKSEQVFDITTITGTVKQKRYREYIHQFIDAAAFWGSHIDVGQVALLNEPDPIVSATDIYSTIADKYQTKNKQYLYVQSERGRSYNYYGNYSTGKLNFELAEIPPPPLNLVDYKTQEWPILIKSFEENNTPSGVLDITLDFDIDPNIHATDKHISVYLKTPDWEYECFLFYEKGNRHDLIYDLQNNQDKFTGQTNQNKIRPGIKFNQNSGVYNSISSFIFIEYKGVQNHPLESYPKTLFGIANIQPLFSSVPTQNLCQWVNQYQDTLYNLNDIIFEKNTKIFRRTFFDSGVNGEERRLTVCYINETRSNEKRKDVFPNTSGKENSNDQNNELYKYGINGKIYKGGAFLDGTDSIQSLILGTSEKTIFNYTNLIFQLGVLEEEYNLLLYNNTNGVPQSPPHIPRNAVNIYYHLKEDNDVDEDISKDYRKFELGIEFEDSNGAIQIKSPSNKVYVYTLDGKFFFSKLYSESQEFFHEFAHTRIDFRPKQSWTGEFGLDWIRRGDFKNIDYSGTANDISISYRGMVGHYYKTSARIIKTKNEGETLNYFKDEKEEWLKLKTLYPSFPLSSPSGNELLYSSAWSSLYPSKKNDGTPSGFPSIISNGTTNCLVEADFELNIEITSPPTELKLRFEKDHFQVTSSNPSETTILPDKKIVDIMYGELEINDKTTPLQKMGLHIKCLKEFDNFQNIQAIATENGIEKMAGQIGFIPNTKANRKKVNILLIEVITQLPGQNSNNGNSTGAEDFLSKFFNQALIDVKTNVIQNLDMRTSSFNNDFASVSPNGTPCLKVQTQIGGNNIDIHDVLEEQLNIQYSGYDKNSFKVFFIDEEAWYGNFNIYGIASPGISRINDNAAIFRNGQNTKTITHELFHCGGLYHSFSNFAQLTFEKNGTDNLMDYSELQSPYIPTIGTWKKQWEVLWKHSLIENE